jgi:hypothetical protein
MDRNKSYGGYGNLSLLDKLSQKLSEKYILNFLKKLQHYDSLADIGSGFSANITRPFWHSFGKVYLFYLSLIQKLLSLIHPNIFFSEEDVPGATKIPLGTVNFNEMNNLLDHIDSPVQLLTQVR